jgi:UDP-N-acetylglucosamine:LPS N-acetylglucosamine transferase
MTTSPLPIRLTPAVEAPLTGAIGDIVSDPVRRVLLVGSGGGHLAQLVALEAWWGARDRAWVTFDQADSRSLLVGERVYWAHWPTTRNARNAIRNAWLAGRILREERPDLVISTGAGVAPPFFLQAQRLGISCAFLEVYDRVDSTTMTGRWCRPLSDVFCVQWPDQQKLYPGATLIGPVL